MSNLTLIRHVRSGQIFITTSPHMAATWRIARSRDARPHRGAVGGRGESGWRRV